MSVSAKYVVQHVKAFVILRGRDAVQKGTICSEGAAAASEEYAAVRALTEAIVRFRPSSITPHTTSVRSSREVLVGLPLLAAPLAVPDVVLVAAFRGLQALVGELLDLLPCWSSAIICHGDLQHLDVVFPFRRRSVIVGENSQRRLPRAVVRTVPRDVSWSRASVAHGMRVVKLVIVSRIAIIAQVFVSSLPALSRQPCQVLGSLYGHIVDGLMKSFTASSSLDERLSPVTQFQNELIFQTSISAH